MVSPACGGSHLNVAGPRPFYFLPLGWIKVRDALWWRATVEALLTERWR